MGERISIVGIMFQHGNGNDFGYWNGFSLSEEDNEAIQKILMKYDTEGCSVRGTLEEVVEDMI